MIFIAKDYEGRIISIISAKSNESANAYWQGKNITPFTEEMWDIKKERENEEMGFVTPILETRTEDLKNWKMQDYKKYVIVC